MIYLDCENDLKYNAILYQCQDRHFSFLLLLRLDGISYGENSDSLHGMR